MPHRQTAPYGSWTSPVTPELMTGKTVGLSSLAADGEAFCVIELEPVDGAVKLTINHTVARKDSKLIEAVGGGWPRILSNLKSLLETGQIILKPKP